MNKNDVIIALRKFFMWPFMSPSDQFLASSRTFKKVEFKVVKEGVSFSSNLNDSLHQVTISKTLAGEKHVLYFSNGKFTSTLKVQPGAKLVETLENGGTRPADVAEVFDASDEGTIFVYVSVSDFRRYVTSGSIQVVSFS